MSYLLKVSDSDHLDNSFDLEVDCLMDALLCLVEIYGVESMSDDIVTALVGRVNPVRINPVVSASIIN